MCVSLCACRKHKTEQEIKSSKSDTFYVTIKFVRSITAQEDLCSAPQGVGKLRRSDKPWLQGGR